MFPVGITFIPFAVGMALLFKGKRLAAKVFLLSAFALFFLFSLGWTGLTLLKPLEDAAGL